MVLFYFLILFFDNKRSRCTKLKQSNPSSHSQKIGKTTNANIASSRSERSTVGPPSETFTYMQAEGGSELGLGGLQALTRSGELNSAAYPIIVSILINHLH